MDSDAQARNSEAFGQFQYPTVPLHVSSDLMNTALRKAISPALDAPAGNGKER